MKAKHISLMGYIVYKKRRVGLYWTTLLFLKNRLNFEIYITGLTSITMNESGFICGRPVAPVACGRNSAVGR